MDYAISFLKAKENIKTVATDLLALAFIYFTPAISHLFSFPVYFLEPMRIMLILAIVHTSKKNAYILAFTLPLFSFLISSHPSPIKTCLISGELLLNVWLYIFLVIITKNGMVIRQSVRELRVMGRNTQGVRLIRLNEDDSIADIARVISEDEDLGENGKALEKNGSENVIDDNGTEESLDL